MPLYLATHIVDTVTARVPLAIIVLLDYCKRRSLPPYLLNRFVLPCEKVSISLWDAPGEQELLLWLEDALDQEIRHEVHEVQEEFCWGYTLELTRLRTADKVASSGRSALERITATAVKAGDGFQRQLEALDQRTNILTAAESALARVRAAAGSTLDTAAATYTAAASRATASRAGTPDPSTTPPHAQAGQAAPQQQQLDGGQAAAGGWDAAGHQGTTTASTVAANVQAQLSKASSTFSWLGGRMKAGLINATTTSGLLAPHPPVPAQATMPAMPGSPGLVHPSLDQHPTPGQAWHTQGQGAWGSQPPQPHPTAHSGLVEAEGQQSAAASQLPVSSLPVSTPSDTLSPPLPLSGPVAQHGVPASAPPDHPPPSYAQLHEPGVRSVAPAAAEVQAGREAAPGPGPGVQRQPQGERQAAQSKDLMDGLDQLTLPTSAPMPAFVRLGRNRDAHVQARAPLPKLTLTAACRRDREQLLDVCTSVSPEYWNLKEVALFLTAPNVLDPALAVGLYVRTGASEWVYRGCCHAGHPSEVMPLQVGISIEPGVDIVNKEGSKLGAKEEFAKRVGMDLFRFMESFQTRAMGDMIEVPANVLDRWFLKFSEKFRRDPDFLTRDKERL
ncbi:hypothetical protein QJQ45_002197 [Haematococcus lacustris]|nr:hypothetical protein QJQ45_002197 [Haematococcus lacustris]